MEWIVGVAGIIVSVILYLLSRRKPQPVEIVKPPERDEEIKADLGMDLATFNNRVLPRLQAEGWEVKLPHPERAYAFQLEGWEEVHWPDARSQPRRVTIVSSGSQSPELVPVRRRVPGHGLSDGAKRLVLATHRHTGKFPGCFFVKDFPPQFTVGIDDVHFQDAEARDVLDELQSRGLVESRSDALWCLNREGRVLAEQLQDSK